MLAIGVLSTVTALAQLAPPVADASSEPIVRMTPAAVDAVAKADDSADRPDPEEIVEQILESTDDELAAQIDAMLDQTKAALESGEVSGDEADIARKQIDQLTDLELRKEAIASIRAMSADDLGAAAMAALDQLDEDDAQLPAVTSEKETPAPGTEPNRTEVSSTDPEPAITDPAVLDPAGDPSQPEPKPGSDTAPAPIDPAGGTPKPGSGNPGGGDPASWDLDHRILDQPSLDQFHQSYAEWLGGGAPVAEVPERGGDGTSNRWVEPFDVCTGVLLGTRHAPTVPTRPGTIYTPTIDTFVSDTTPHVVYPSGGYNPGGQLTVRTNPTTGAEEFLVESHILSDSLLIGFFRPEITIERLTGPLVVYSPDNSNVTVKCYAEDAGRVFVTRAYVSAWIPFSVVSEPGFQVRVDVTGRIAPHLLFFGADQASVHVGPQPVRWNEAVPSAVGVDVDDSLLVDSNNEAADDLEATVRNLVNTAGTEAIDDAQGTFAAWLPPVLGFWLFDTKVIQPITSDVDLWAIAKGSRERQLGVSVSAPENRLMGVLRAGPFTCAFRYKFRATATVGAVVDVDDTNRFDLEPELRTNDISIGTRSLVVLPLSIWPWNIAACAVLWATAAIALPSVASNLVEKKLGKLFEPDGKIDTLISGFDVRGKLATGLALPNGNGVSFPSVSGAGFTDTCPIYGCRGGDVALIDEGLELGTSLNATDRKLRFGILGFNHHRRFPNVYAPSNTQPVSALLHDHRDANGAPYSLGVELESTFVNQIFRSLTEGSKGQRPGMPLSTVNGILDQRFNIDGRPAIVSPTVAPMAVNIPSPDPATFPMSVLAPDIRLSYDDGSGPDNPILLGVDVFAGVGATQATFDTIDPSFIFRTDTTVLNCHGLLWIECGKSGITGIPTLTAFVDGLVALVSDALDASVGNIPLPSPVAGAEFANVRLQRRGSSWAVYTDIAAAPRVSVTSWHDKPWYGFSAAAEHLPGTGPISYRWVVTDELNRGAVVSDTTTTSNWITLDMRGLTALRLRKGNIWHHSKWRRIAKGTVTARRGGRSVSVSVTRVMDTEKG